MAEVVRPVSYTGTMQRLIVDATTTGNITAYLWGGAGGGGAGDGGVVGGTGAGGNFSSITMAVVPGDVIDVAVGGGGGPGTGSRWLVGGPGGASYQAVDPVWTTLSLQPILGRATSQPYIDQFVNLYGVTGTVTSYDQTFTVPSTAVYQFRAAAYLSSGTFTIDPGPGETSISAFSGSSPTISVTLTAGSHVIRSTILGTPAYSISASIRLDSALYTGYSGAQGGWSGISGSSGSGGGSGGATVLFKNGVLQAVAGGGAGAGGAGVRGGSGTAPASTARAAPGTNAGQQGQGTAFGFGDGGGGGSGGGGYGGGDGNLFGFGDVSGLGGAQGGNFGPSTQFATGKQPANAASPYRFGSAGVGGQGGTIGVPTIAGESGLATFVFDVVGSFVKSSGTWTPVQETYVKDQGVWKSVLEQYVKQNGQWRLVSGTNATAPTFTGISGNFGVSDRPYPPLPLE